MPFISIDRAKVYNNFVDFIKNLIVCFYVLIDFIYILRGHAFFVMSMCDIIITFELPNALSYDGKQNLGGGRRGGSV